MHLIIHKKKKKKMLVDVALEFMKTKEKQENA